MDFQSNKSINKESKETLQKTLRQLIKMIDIRFESNFQNILDALLAEEIVILLEPLDEAIIINQIKKGNTERGITEPESEHIIRGPKDGFTENLFTNMSLIRKRIRTPELKMEQLTIGRLSKTKVIVSYIKNIADEKIVSEVFNRLKTIDIDGIMASCYIEEYIEDNALSPFPQVDNTEKPDVVAANLLEGRVAILTENTPTCLIVPLTFFQSMQINEDHYERPLVSSFIRFLRFVFLFLALFLPAIYIALETYHHEMIATKLLIRMTKSREGIPFPAYFEALFMAIFLEALREAATRLPKNIGQTVSIVGALVIGEVAIRAGIVSDTMVLVIGITAVSNFAIPKYNQALTIRLLRLILMFLAAFLGLFGVLIGFYCILTHMCNLESFGVSYLHPLAPFNPQGLKDTFIRVPRWGMIHRITGKVNNSKRSAITSSKFFSFIKTGAKK
jgi:spore germination protein KA